VGNISEDLEKDVMTYNHNPLIVAVQNIYITETGFSRTTVDGSNINLHLDQDSKYHEMFKVFHSQKLNLGVDDYQFYEQEMERRVFWRYEELIYENCWD